MQFDLTTLEDGIKVAKLVGRLDLQGTNEIDDRFTFSISSHSDSVLVDMSEVEFLASIGMRMLISNAKAVNRRGGKFVLVSPTPLVKDALITAGFESLIPMYDDFDSAYAAVKVAVPE